MLKCVNVLNKCLQRRSSIWTFFRVFSSNDEYWESLEKSHDCLYYLRTEKKMMCSAAWCVVSVVCCRGSNAWWRHQMETFSALLDFCVGNSPITGEFPTQSPVARCFDVFFYLLLNKRLSKQWWGWWFDTPSRPLWRHCNAPVLLNPDRRALALPHCIEVCSTSWD